VLPEEAAEAVGQPRVSFREKGAVERFRRRRGVAIRGLEQDRHVRRCGADLSNQSQTGVGSQFAVFRKLDVGDHAEQAVLVALEHRQRGFVVARQNYFGPGAHAQHSVAEIDPFFDQRSRLQQDFRVELRQIIGIKPDRVLDKQDDLNAAFQHVVFDVSRVLDLLDHRQQNADVAVPKIGAVHSMQFLGLQAIEIGGAVCQQSDRCVGRAPLDFLGEPFERHRADARHGDDQIEGGFGEAIERFLSGRNAGYTGGIAQLESLVLPEQHVVQPVVLPDDERVVRARHEEDFPDLERRQPIESRKGGFEIG